MSAETGAMRILITSHHHRYFKSAGYIVGRKPGSRLKTFVVKLDNGDTTEVSAGDFQHLTQQAARFNA